jgi:hypothetical protein
MLLNSTRWSTSEDVGSGMGHPPVRTTLGQLGHETAALLPAWPARPPSVRPMPSRRDSLMITILSKTHYGPKSPSGRRRSKRADAHHAEA